MSTLEETNVFDETRSAALFKCLPRSPGRRFSGHFQFGSDVWIARACAFHALSFFGAPERKLLVADWVLFEFLTRAGGESIMEARAQGGQMTRNEVLFSLLVVASSVVLLVSGSTMAKGLAVALGLFSGVWVISLILRDASIADVFWGPGIAAVGWFYFASGERTTWLGWTTVLLASVWAFRLALYILVRNAGRGEDYRYRKWREASGPSFWWVSFFKVFALQGVLAWIVASPLAVSQSLAGARPGFTLATAGFGMFWVGFVYEAIADWQLYRFKSEPANSGKVFDCGLWSLSRHPNYLGEAVLWWGIGLMALSVGGWMALVGPALLTFTLLRVSGVAMLDRELVHRRPGYDRYISEIPAFLPLKLSRIRDFLRAKNSA
jgi:steroid 5-alpha reductase family enzyme